MTERSTTLTIAGVAGIGLIHLLDSVDTFHETRWLFWAYVALMAATIVVAGALLHHPDRARVRGRGARRAHPAGRLHPEPHDGPSRAPTTTSATGPTRSAWRRCGWRAQSR